MKHLLHALLLLACFSSYALADTPARIAEDYHKASAAALVKVNETLEKAVVPLIAALVKSGDTAGADELRAQLKTKIAGDPVLTPQASAANVFKLYDAARVKALEPAQKAAVARIDAMLSSSEGGKLEVVAELSQVRAEIEAGKGMGLAQRPVEWSFRKSPTGASYGTFMLHPDGTAEMQGGGGNSGKWKPLKKANTLSVEWVNPKDTWTVIFAEGNDLAEVRSMVWTETRYLKAMTAPPGK